MTHRIFLSNFVQRFKDKYYNDGIVRLKKNILIHIKS